MTSTGPVGPYSRYWATHTCESNTVGQVDRVRGQPQLPAEAVEPLAARVGDHALEGDHVEHLGRGAGRQGQVADTVEQRLRRVEVALVVGERPGDQAHPGVRVVGHARQGVGRGGDVAVADVRPGHAGQQPGDRVRRRLAERPAVARHGGRVALLGEGVGPQLEQPEAGGLVGDVGVGGAAQHLAVELRVPGRPGRPQLVRGGLGCGPRRHRARRRSRRGRRRGRRGPAPPPARCRRGRRGTPRRPAWRPRPDPRTGGRVASVPVARRLGQRHRARRVGPLELGGRAEVVELHDLAEHGRGAQDGEHVRGEVLGRRLRGVDHDGLEGLPGTRPGAEGHDDRDGLAARLPRARWRNRSTVCGSTRWTSSTTMTTPPAAAARTSARAATKTAVGGRGRAPAEQRLQLGAAAVGDVGQQARPPAARSRRAPRPRWRTPAARPRRGPARTRSPPSSAAWRRSSTRWRHAWPDPVTATARPAPAARPATIPDTSWCGDGVRRRAGGRRRLGDPADADLDHLPDEAEAPPVDRADQALIAPVVADRPPGGLDAARQGRLGDEPVAPDLVEQLGLRDDPVAVPDEVVEHVHDLWLDRDLLAATLELHRVGVERHVSESHPHRRQLRAARGRGGVLHAAPHRLQACSSVGGGRSEATPSPHRSP